MKFDPQQLIYQPGKYEITIPGRLDASWMEWFEDLVITEDLIEDDILVSKISGVFDQAGLHGLIRRLYTYGLPIISISYVSQKASDHAQQE